MIKFAGKKEDGKDLIGIGLSELNMNRLLEGKPIVIKGEEINFPDLEILIMGGANEAVIYKQLEDSGLVTMGKTKITPDAEIGVTH